MDINSSRDHLFEEIVRIGKIEDENEKQKQLDILKKKSEKLMSLPEDDIYLVDLDFHWTYVVTHEKEQCGPYFFKNNHT
ncbi:DUF4275 family protein [Desulfosporosinus nitroreducens]|uniref:DUF4275 family protein n=1 Tax=Desulfosporosinus nitroreducens TaxID=2018668 RepID=A0ABT8QSL1_9FIRM|nr:DUF4275 family protein [Desulfosporosinus nitroreducens]MDO0824125.1 DUF4275 family protein [Desulfosporosinus nitroreducens]